MKVLLVLSATLLAPWMADDRKVGMTMDDWIIRGKYQWGNVSRGLAEKGSTFDQVSAVILVCLMASA